MTDDTAASDANDHGAPQDVRDKFREALERKKEAGGRAGSAHGPDHDKASGATANQKRQREFRRKSGG